MLSGSTSSSVPLAALDSSSSSWVAHVDLYTSCSCCTSFLRSSSLIVLLSNLLTLSFTFSLLFSFSFLFSSSSLLAAILSSSFFFSFSLFPLNSSDFFISNSSCLQSRIHLLHHLLRLIFILFNSAIDLLYLLRQFLNFRV